MKKLLFFFIALLFTISSCRDDIVVKNTPVNVFLAFWKTMNEGYIYFEEKKINWDSIYSVYYPRALSAKDDDELFGIMSEIIPQFKDRHLSLSKNTTKGVGYLPDSNYYYLIPYMKQYGFNTLPKHQDQYFVTYQHATKNYAYVSYSSFSFVQDMSLVVSCLDSLNFHDGLILDIRNNSGGYLNNMLEILSLFYSDEQIVLYKVSKKSSKKNDFNTPIPYKYKGRNIVPHTVPIILLTGSKTYSAGNFFAYILNDLPNCITVGKPTGGGGSPVKYEYLPNGWVLGYPYIKSYTIKGENMEFGLNPDVYVNYNFWKDTTDTHFRKALSILDSINSIKK